MQGAILWLLREVGGWFGTHWAEITMAWPFVWSKERRGRPWARRWPRPFHTGWFATYLVSFPWCSCCSGGGLVPTVSASAGNEGGGAPSSSWRPSSLASSGSVAGLLMTQNGADEPSRPHGSLAISRWEVGDKEVATVCSQKFTYLKLRSELPGCRRALCNTEKQHASEQRQPVMPSFQNRKVVPAVFQA
ncbi:hypothetical protein BDZ97DRAFT_1854416 [Flammula alnicola]|nr:hypothetical protein BDZ97DRAFT_1854416 [Flammula alnicola]